MSETEVTVTTETPEETTTEQSPSPPETDLATIASLAESVGALKVATAAALEASASATARTDDLSRGLEVLNQSVGELSTRTAALGEQVALLAVETSDEETAEEVIAEAPPASEAEPEKSRNPLHRLFLG